MQPIKFLGKWLEANANKKSFMYTNNDLRSLFGELTDVAFKTLLSRAVSSGVLMRLCRGIYFYQKANPSDGLMLFHAASALRSNSFNYISMETVLSDAGIISQIPMNWIVMMSSGRSNIISCGEFGNIEFVHTNQKPSDLIGQLTYDTQCGLWRANVALALRDMKATHRNTDLIDWDIANEFI